MKILLLISCMILSGGLFCQTKTNSRVPPQKTGSLQSEKKQLAMACMGCGEKLIISFKKTEGPLSVSLCDGSGREVFSDSGLMDVKELSVNTSGFKKGFYTLKVSVNNFETSRRVLVD